MKNTEKIDRDEMTAILRDIARNGGDTARIQAIKTLLALDEEEGTESDFDELYPDEVQAARERRAVLSRSQSTTFASTPGSSSTTTSSAASPRTGSSTFCEDLFAGRRENWLITPEGNGKTTFTAILAVYGADFSPSPWIPVAAASAKQARILHDQAGGFIRRTPGLLKRFRVYDGYFRIASTRTAAAGSTSSPPTRRPATG